MDQYAFVTGKPVFFPFSMYVVDEKDPRQKPCPQAVFIKDNRLYIDNCPLEIAVVARQDIPGILEKGIDAVHSNVINAMLHSSAQAVFRERIIAMLPRSEHEEQSIKILFAGTIFKNAWGDDCVRALSYCARPRKGKIIESCVHWLNSKAPNPTNRTRRKFHPLPVFTLALMGAT